MIIYLLILLAGLYFLARKRCTEKRKELPGPKGLPFVGNGLDINESNIVDKIEELAKVYGDVFSIKMFNQRVLCVNSVDSIKTLLTENCYKRHTNDRNKMFYGEYLMSGSQSIAFYKYGFSTVHNNMRKAFTKGLHVYGEGIQQFEKSVLSELENLNRKIENANGGELDLVSMFQRSLSNIMSITMSGQTLDDNDPDVNLFWEYLDGAIFVAPSVNLLMLAMPFLRYLPGVYKRTFDKMVVIKEKMTQRYFTTMKETFVPGRPRGMVDVLLEEQLREKQTRQTVTLTDERIICMVLETIAAGIITTWALLSSTMLCLLNHPEYQDKVYHLLCDVIGGEREVTHSDKQSCPLLEAIEMEVHRLITVVPLMQRDLSTELQFKGFHVPKNTMFLGNAWYVHHNEKTWGDPWTFRPERFLDENGQLLPSEHVLRQSWIPFGMGRRSCVGEPFARSRYFLFMATLLQRWKFTPTPGRCWPCDPRQKEYFHFSLTLRPKPFFCTAERRT